MLRYQNIDKLQGPLLFIQNVKNVGYQELVRICDENKKEYFGQVIALENELALVQLFSNVAGLKISTAQAVFAGESKKIALSPAILGRIFNGFGSPIDTGEDFINQKSNSNLPYSYRDVNGAAINPYVRARPNRFIQTGVSGIDLTNTVAIGQKIPIFSGSGLPDLELLASIAKNARTANANEKFVVVVAGMGITNDQYSYLKKSLEDTGAISRTVMFINKSSDPVVERILTPRLALTTAEYLAYDLGFQVLVLMSDLTSYAGALREVSAAKKEIPGRSGYPGYMYTDLANLLERAGVVDGKAGSVTQIPILTMPNFDKTSVVPDVTGYITEGQIVLDPKLHKQGIYPPIDILGSLSRLKNEVQGEGNTREDHSKVADQIIASLAESSRQQELVMVFGADSLT